MRSDDALQRAVLEELLRDARVEAAEVGVQVDGGW
jgi:hypothetical protein